MYKLFTDTDCDVTYKKAKELGVGLISMPYTLDDKEIYPYVDFIDFNAKEYYDKLRAGSTPKTSGVSPDAYMQYFEPVLQEGNDVLYVHFSEAISGTFNAMRIAMEQLKEKYPERSIEVIDTKTISIMAHNIVEDVVELYNQGKTIEEIKEWADKEIYHYSMYFFAEDLSFFKRSGRVKAFSAFVGNILGIKPIITINNEGQMVSIDKCRGKNATISRILAIIRQKQENIKDHKVFIGHTDNIETAENIKEKLKEEYGQDLNIEVVEINPTIGAHCGPGCVGVSFHSKER